MTGKVWKLSDTVAAAFFGIWLFSLFFRPFFGGLDIIAFSVAGIWGLSVWARAKHGDYIPVELTNGQKKDLDRLQDWNNDLLTNPAHDNLPSNAGYKHDD